MKKLLAILFFVLLCALSLGGSWYFWTTQLGPTGYISTIPFIVKPGETATSVMARLKQQKLIRSELATKIYLKLSPQFSSIKPGSYVLKPNLSTPEIFTVLNSGPQDIWITIPEGWRREQIASRLKNSLTDFDFDKFVQISTSYEGQLFPDTYLIPAGASPDAALSILIKNFTKKTQLDVTQPTNYQSLVLASLIEREAKADSERPVIAGILLKRLEASWPLQIDATVQYAQDTSKCASSLETCDWWKPIADTKYPSPYNTYLHVGLPPFPISNPGLASIKAAMAPETSQYWYYLHDSTGKIHYATSLAEHNRNIDKYLKP